MGLLNQAARPAQSSIPARLHALIDVKPASQTTGASVQERLL
jgi:hypothetical protein